MGSVSESIFFKTDYMHSDAMKWLLWTPCLSVWAHAGSCFAQRLSSCSFPTSPAFDCTTCVLLMTTMRIKRRRSKKTQRMEKPLGLRPNRRQQMQAERKVCVSVHWSLQPQVYTAVFVCCDLCVFFRAEHTCMLWWTASMVSGRLHSVAWWRCSTGRVRSGSCFTFWLCRWVYTHTHKHTLRSNCQSMLWLLLCVS